MKIRASVHFPSFALPSIRAERWRDAWHRDESTAFTRLELLAVLCVLALLAAIALPVLAGSRPRSEQITCLNNLRQLGQAVQIWDNEHGEGPPARIPYADGGLYGAPDPIAGLREFAYFHFLWMSNEIGTPRILACPSDPTVKVASDFSRNSYTGFANDAFQNRSVSYFIGLDVTHDMPLAILCGDRNMISNGFPSRCSSGIQQAAVVYSDSPSTHGWAPGIHGDTGNLLISDGGVEQASRSELSRLIGIANDDYAAFHVLFPR